MYDFAVPIHCIISLVPHKRYFMSSHGEHVWRKLLAEKTIYGTNISLLIH